MSVVQSLALTDSSNQYGRFLIKIDSRNYAFEHLREYIDLSVFEFYCIDKENYRSLFYFKIIDILIYILIHDPN